MAKDSISIAKAGGLVLIVGSLLTGGIVIGSKPSSDDVDKKVLRIEAMSKKDCRDLRREFHSEIRQIKKDMSGLRMEIKTDLSEFRKDLRALLRTPKK